MRKIFSCRRSSLALIGIVCLTALGVHVGTDISGIAVAISGIVASVSASNAWQKRSDNGK
jgi:hypothetical protein